MSMKRASLLLCCLTALCGVILAAEGKSAKPNIVLILADDLGYNDLSCQGATRLRTPGIDRLARTNSAITTAGKTSVAR